MKYILSIFFLVIVHSGVLSAAQMINIKDAPFNASGDGSNDDTSKIIAAINSANNGDVIYFPPGVYNLASMGSIFINKNVSLLGKNATLNGVDSSYQASFVLEGNLNGITIEGMHFDNFSTAITTRNTNNKHSDIRITGNRFTRSAGGIMLASGVKNAMIMNNVFKDIYAKSAIRIGIEAIDNDLEHSDTIIIKNNIIKNVSNQNDDNAIYGIQALGRNLTVTDNTIDTVFTTSSSSYSSGIYIKAYNAIISNNLLIDAGKRSYLQLKGGESSEHVTQGDYIASGNIFKTNNITPENIVGIYEEGIVLSNNRFVYCKASDAIVGIMATPSRRVKIKDNTFRKCDSNIYIKTSSSDTEITENNFYQLVNSGETHSSVISISTSSFEPTLSNVLIERNKFFFDSDFSPSRGTHYVIGFTVTGENTNGIYIRNNELFGFNKSNIDNSAVNLRAIRFYDNESGGTNKHYDISNNVFHGSWRDSDDYTSLLNFSIDGNLKLDNKPAGGEVSLTTATHLSTDETGISIDNENASEDITHNLPEAKKGIVFRGINVENHTLRFKPATTNQILGGAGGGKYVELSPGASIELKALVEGQWNITKQTGDISFQE